jgi:ADP-heptose:LPS heptosyltransferase
MHAFALLDSAFRPVSSVLVSCTGGGIGDVLLATPLIRALATRFARVVALTSARHRDVLLSNPALAAVYADEGSLWELTRRIAAERFDAAVVTWETPRAALVPLLARIPVRVGQSRRLSSYCFTDRVRIRSEFGDRTTHWTQILLDYGRALGCDETDAVPSYTIDSAAHAGAAELLDQHGIREPFAVLHPCRGIVARRSAWPAEPFAAIAVRVRERMGCEILVTGAAAERELAERIAAHSGARSVAGETSLGVFAALAQRARGVIAVDSGPMHLAAAVGAPTLGIFPMQSDEPARWAPLGPRTAVMLPEYPCPPAHRKETCGDFACVAALDSERIARTFAKLILPVETPGR